MNSFNPKSASFIRSDTFLPSFIGGVSRSKTKNPATSEKLGRRTATDRTKGV